MAVQNLFWQFIYCNIWQSNRRETTSSLQNLIMTSSCFRFLGPFRYLDAYGADKFVERMHRLHESIGGDRFVPCQMLLDYAKDPSKKFHKR